MPLNSAQGTVGLDDEQAGEQAADDDHHRLADRAGQKAAIPKAPTRTISSWVRLPEIRSARLSPALVALDPAAARLLRHRGGRRRASARASEATRNER